MLGANAIGVVGSDAKVAYLKECGIPAFNYRAPGGARLLVARNTKVGDIPRMLAPGNSTLGSWGI